MERLGNTPEQPWRTRIAGILGNIAGRRSVQPPVGSPEWDVAPTAYNTTDLVGFQRGTDHLLGPLDILDIHTMDEPFTVDDLLGRIDERSSWPEPLTDND